MKKHLKYLLIIVLISNTLLYSQQKDTLQKVDLEEIIITDKQSSTGIDRMPDVKDNVIYAGKKNEVVLLSKSNADLSTNNSRQLFVKVPGIHVWESDGSGIQTSIATRGLSPNRSWEFNVRQNGYDISPDIFGYPEAYYTPPTEAIEKIEVIRGASSLQYGPQFGGLINYQFKKANPVKKISVESAQTLGSYGLFNSYNSLSGTIKKFNYFGFLHYRSANGWRENSKYNSLTGHIALGYQVSKKIRINAEYTKMDFTSQQAGGLTDADFKTNARQSSRARNWFGAPWNVGSIAIKYDITNNLNVQLKTFVTASERNSVGYLKSINFKDSINPSTQQYNTRQVDRDYYQNYGAELRVSLKYNLFKKQHVLAGGVRGYYGTIKRDQLGVGSTGTDFALNLTNPQYGRSLEFSTTNMAAFAENIFYIGNRIKIIPGIRLENIDNTAKGYINTTSTGQINTNKITRSILLYGVGSEISITKKTNVYFNYSLGYRPVTFSELTPSATTEIIDPNLKDASGYNMDLGYRGSLKEFLKFDISAYYLLYNNRVGSITQNGNLFRTNIGTSESKGVESFIEISPIAIFTDNLNFGDLNIFTSNSYINAIYTKWNNPAIASDPTKSIENKRVENAPQFIHRYGLSYTLKGFSLSAQYSYVGDVYTDAANTEVANATATLGKLPAYKVIDATIGYIFLKHYSLKIGVNNLTDEIYATRRSGGYPGPGILPANGRTFYATFAIKF